MREPLFHFHLEGVVIANALIEIDWKLTEEGERRSRSNRAGPHFTRKRRVIHRLDEQVSTP